MSVQRMSVEYLCHAVVKNPFDAVAFPGQTVVSLGGPYRDLTVVGHDYGFQGMSNDDGPLHFRPGRKYRVVIEDVTENSVRSADAPKETAK